MEVLPCNRYCENVSITLTLKTGIVTRKFSRSYRVHAVLCVAPKWLGRCAGVS